MNARMLPVFIKLLGKIVVKYDILSDLTSYDDAERDILRLAKTEYDFYRPERVEVPFTSASYNAVQESNVGSAGKREKLGLKTPR